MECKVYILVDPRDDFFNPRYVGITNKRYLSDRLGGHVMDSKKYKHHNANWTRSLINAGVRPCIKLVDIVDSWEDACNMEIALIKHFRKKYNLNNHTDGGDGVVGYKPSAETIEKSRLSHLGYKPSDETRKKISAALIGHPSSAETREKIGAAKRGNKFWLGKKHSKETLSKLRVSKLNQSEETRKKISISNSNQPIVECPYCGKSGKGSAMYRWHFDNCKFKPLSNV